MRVLHFLDTLNRGGAERIALDVCRNAKRHGIELTIATAKGGAMEEDFRNSGAEFIKLDRRLPIDANLARKLRKIIKERKIEFVQGYQAVEGLHLYMACLGMKKVKKVLSFQGGLVPDWKNAKTVRFLIPRMDANIIVSEALRNRHAKIDKFNTERNFHVIYNCVDRSRLAPSGESVKKELGIPEDAMLIGMIGNLYAAERKDQLTICKALPKIFAEIPNAHCIFVGKVEKGAEAKFDRCVGLCGEAGILDRVHFTGAREDIPDILDELDLFIFSSLNEGLPIACIEAMFARAPLLVSDIEELLEITENGRHGEVFRKKDEADLAEKAIRLLKDEALRKKYADSAYAFAEEHFSIYAHLKNLKKLYESL